MSSLSRSLSLSLSQEVSDLYEFLSFAEHEDYILKNVGNQTVAGSLRNMDKNVTLDHKTSHKGQYFDIVIHLKGE